MGPYKHTCKLCNKEIIYEKYKSYWTAKNRNGMCKSCRTTTANKSPRRYSKRENNPFWKGYKEIPYTWFSAYFIRKVRKKQHSGDITIEQVYEMWIKQDKKCALSGIPIGFYDDAHRHTCSIDRIDSSGEYTIDNIQLVHKDVNIMKNKFENQYFIQMCKRVTDKHE